MATLDPYLSTLCQYLYVGDVEYAGRVAGFEALSSWLRSRLPGAASTRMFGSSMRRTALSARVHPNSGVDLLLVIERAAFLRGYPRLFTDLSALLEQQREGTLLRESAPCVSLRYRGGTYAVFPVMHGGEDCYVFAPPHGEWSERRPSSLGPRDGRFHYGSAGILSGHAAPGKDALRPAYPFFRQRTVETYIEGVYKGFHEDDRYGGLWRGLVLLLKYWILSRPAEPCAAWMAGVPWSYVLEENALIALSDAARFRGCRGLFDFLHRFLSNPTFYDYALLSQLPGFLDLKQQVECLQTPGAGADSEAASRALAAIFPVPTPPLGLGPADWLEADLMRARLAVLAAEPEQALGILRTALGRTERERDERVVEMRCAAEFSVGQIEQRLGRAHAAVSAYRRAIERYQARADVPGIALWRMRALAAEAETHRVAGHLTLAMTALDQLLSSYGTDTDPETSLLVARALFDKANVLHALGQSREASALHRELVRCYAGVTSVAMMQLVAKSLYNSALIAHAARDTPGELTCYLDLIARFGEHRDLEIQEIVTMALSGEAFALLRMNDYESALEAFEQLAARCSVLVGTRYEEQAVAARIWSAIVQDLLHRPGSRANLERIASGFPGESREQVVRAVAAARASLASA